LPPPTITGNAYTQNSSIKSSRETASSGLPSWRVPSISRLRRVTVAAASLRRTIVTPSGTVWTVSENTYLGVSL
jgi:hypothetical protein